MRNTLLITLDFWPNKGGVANYYYNLVKNFPRDNVFILTNAKKEDSNLRIYNQPLLYKLIWPHWLSALKTTIKLIKKHNVEILWAGDLLPSGTIAYIIHKLFKIPYFVSLHGLDIINSQKHSRKRKLTNKILANAKFITVNSQCTKNLLKDLVEDQGKIKIIYPGVSEKFSEIDELKLKKIKNKYSLKNKKIILTTGRLINRKNQQLVIDAIKKLKEKIPNLIYLIIGNGPKKKDYELKIKAYGLENNVKILTNIENDKLPYFYKLSDIFVMVSKTTSDDIEGFGIVYLEAGIFAKPVIASAEGGSKEAVLENETGLLIKEDNLKTLKDDIIKLLEDKELANRLGNNAQIRIKKKFLWKDISKKLMKHIDG
jgi:phosphatidylinositol alpha-1,6-mannosyltransferase